MKARYIRTDVGTIDLDEVRTYFAGLEALGREMKQSHDIRVIRDGLKLLKRQWRTVDGFTRTLTRSEAA